MTVMVNSQPLFPPPEKEKLGLPFCLHLLTVPQVSTSAGEVGSDAPRCRCVDFCVVGNELLP